MKRSSKIQGVQDRRSRSGRLKSRIAQPAKRLSELVTVYEDLEKTLKGLKARALLQGGNSLREINIQKLIAQLSKSKRRIERKISATLVNERAQMKNQLSKWAPKIKVKHWGDRSNRHI